MTFAAERPNSFSDALQLARKILSSSRELVSRGTIDAEAVEIVRAAFRASAGGDLSKLELFARGRDRFPENAGDTVIVLSHSRAEGKLLQHLTGRQTFLEHEYEVNASVLVPRPETELLARLAIEELQNRTALPALGMEIGLGSGVISGELLSAFSGLRMVSSETSEAAIVVAQSNLKRILGTGAERLSVIHVKRPEDVLSPFGPPLFKGPADFLISNPPYLAPEDEIDDEVRKNEPAGALFPAGGDPLHFYSEIAANAAAFLCPPALVVVELAAERAAEVAELFDDAGWKWRLYPDLNDLPRVLIATGK